MFFPNGNFEIDTFREWGCFESQTRIKTTKKGLLILYIYADLSTLGNQLQKASMLKAYTLIKEFFRINASKYQQVIIKNLQIYLLKVICSNCLD